jgi:hypothetical protein
MCIVLVGLGGSAFLLPAGGHDEAEPTSTGGQVPCIVPANGEELCGHDAAIWCKLRPSVEAEPGFPKATRDDCVPVVRWTSY